MARKLVPANPRSGIDIDNNALKIVKIFQPEALKEFAAFDIERFFEFDLEELTGVKCDYRELDYGIHGYTDSDAMECVVCESLLEDPRQIHFCRSTMAHEAGHAVQHVHEFRKKKAVLQSMHDNAHVSLRLYRETDIPLYMNPEWQAFRFAGAILMPTPAVTELVRRGHSIDDISEIFQVSIPFVKSRLKALKITCPT